MTNGNGSDNSPMFHVFISGYRIVILIHIISSTAVTLTEPEPEVWRRTDNGKVADIGLGLNIG